jgi:hypothetical protein
MNSTDTPRFQQIQHAFTMHLRDPQANPAPAGIEDRRMAIYRRLIFNNVSSLLGKNFPVLKSIYAAQHWNELVRDFLRSHHAKTPLFPEIGQEFIAFIDAHRGSQAHNSDDNPGEDPGFLLELAHYEWAETDLLLQITELDPDAYDAQCNLLTGIPVLSPLTRLLGYHWPVHRISKTFLPDKPLPQPVWLLLQRNRKQRVTFMELQPATAVLCELLQHNRNANGTQILQQLAARFKQTADAEFIQQGHAEMQRLHRKGVIPGILVKA